MTTHEKIWAAIQEARTTGKVVYIAGHWGQKIAVCPDDTSARVEDRIDAGFECGLHGEGA